MNRWIIIGAMRTWWWRWR